MFKASFKDTESAEKFGLTVKDIGIVTANETRDGVAYMTVQFEKVEVNGLPAEVFNLEDEPEPIQEVAE